ncbi:hypothetical protein GGR57DRAFT_453906 [Xylariaceae sp. FL1272]|nr:hypothetical protein GGR57DRAFT_453906 [Xylariaceae sp. FL1272]
MASTTPEVKVEVSPAESFMSTPGEFYPSLFPNASTDIDDMDSAMTPESLGEAASTPAPETPAASTTESEKKPAKKRKSWGQVLPEPKTNLPPRKRAKTEDEKEQRRVERVLRNRRAAQSSRERKRQEVEALEQRNEVLQNQLVEQQKQNMRLLQELEKLRNGSVSQDSSTAEFQPSPITLSPPLFPNAPVPGMKEELIALPETVNPASISPEMNPVADDEVSSAPTETTSTDATQHPAVMLWDLQCPSVKAPSSWVASRNPLPPVLSMYLQLQTLMMVSSALVSACSRPMTLIRGALKANLALQPTPSILSTIIWLVTLPPTVTTLTSVNSSRMSAEPQARPQDSTRTSRNPNSSSASTLRIKSLQKLLTSSPILARPLMDATMGLLRSVSEGREDRVDGLAFGSPGIKGDQSRGLLLWPEGFSLPSRELLLTLLWAIKVEERKLSSKRNTILSSSSSRPGSIVLRKKTPTTSNTVSSGITKRRRETTAEEIKKRFLSGKGKARG